MLGECVASSKTNTINNTIFPWVYSAWERKRNNLKSSALNKILTEIPFKGLPEQMCARSGTDEVGFLNDKMKVNL